MTSTLDPDNLSNRPPLPQKGHDIRSLGPSDSSDSGSDMAASDSDEGEPIDGDPIDGERGASIGRDDDSDRNGTGEHLTANREPHLRVAGDIEVDRVVDAGEAGLGGGLDQAEEARLGVTDESLEGDFDDDGEPIEKKPAGRPRKY